ncbi:MAG: alpha/beta hydrolase [Muribaculaceae bacterium]|nr:alpha/beta hydrolase [Muribaculaceae bacterium]
MKHTTILAILAAGCALSARGGMPVEFIPSNEIVVKVWEEGAPNSNFTTVSLEDSIEWNAVSEPLLHIFPAENPVGKVVLMCPGGGYRHLGVQNEGYSFVPWYNDQGVDVAVLQYRMPYGHPEVPLSDVHQSMRLLRDRFPSSLVGVQGFSAGGHLASMAATHYADSITRPDFQILFYPVIAVSGPTTHAGTAQRLLGENPTAEMQQLYNNHLQVTADTPPTFITHSSDDSIVPVANSLDYYSALVANGVPAAMHIYPTGDHGWGFAKGFVYFPMWTAELALWISTLK